MNWIRKHDPFLEDVRLAERECDARMIERILVLAARRGTAAVTFPALPDVFEVRLGVTRGTHGVVPAITLPDTLKRMSWAAGVRINLLFPIDQDFLGARCKVESGADGRLVLHRPETLYRTRPPVRHRWPLPGDRVHVNLTFELPGEPEQRVRVSALAMCGCGGTLPAGANRRSGLTVPLELTINGRGYRVSGRMSSLVAQPDGTRTFWIDFEPAPASFDRALHALLSGQLGYPVTLPSDEPAQEARSA
jgi:hypothetical protein